MFTMFAELQKKVVYLRDEMKKECYGISVISYEFKKILLGQWYNTKEEYKKEHTSE